MNRQDYLARKTFNITTKTSKGKVQTQYTPNKKSKKSIKKSSEGK